jgi:hypothetical protein
VAKPEGGTEGTESGCKTQTCTHTRLQCRRRTRGGASVPPEAGVGGMVPSRALGACPPIGRLSIDLGVSSRGERAALPGPGVRWGLAPAVSSTAAMGAREGLRDGAWSHRDACEWWGAPGGMPPGPCEGTPGPVSQAVGSSWLERLTVHHHQL